MTTGHLIYDPGALGLNIFRKTGNELLCLCPYHDDTSPSATYNPAKAIFHCFTCKESKTAHELAHDLGGALIPVSDTEAYRERSGADTSWLNLLKNPLVEPGTWGHHYLTSRLVTNAQMKRYEIRENKEGVIIPLRDRFDIVTGVIVRHLDKEPKYMFYGERPPIWPFWNMSLSFIQTSATYIVEGVFGVMRLERLRYNAVASMGTGHTSQVGQLLTSNSRLPVSFFDPDYAGRLAAGKLLIAYNIPAILNDKCADEIDDAKEVSEYKVTRDVMDLIEASPSPGKLEAALRNFWRKL